MSYSRLKKGQSSVEFVFSFLMLLGLFALLFAFVSTNYEHISTDNEYSQLKLIASNYYTEIKLASESPHGYRRNFSTTGFRLNGNTVSFQNGTAIVVTSISNKQYVEFLLDEEYFTDDFCEGVNEVLHSEHYGIHVCCGVCNIDYGIYECTTKNESKLDGVWRSCSDEFDTDPQHYRVSCPLGYDSVYINVTKVSAPATYVVNEILTVLSSIDYPDKLWFNGTTPVALPSGGYNFNSTCINSTDSLPRTEVITVA